MISVEGLKVEFNATPLFEDVSYVINKKDRIALVGKNGAGKSTMLKILAGLQQPTSGVVAIPRECTIGYLPQVMILSDKRTVMQEAELAFEHIFEMQADIERMNQQLAERTDYDSEEYHKLIDRFTHENERFLMMGGTNFRAEIERTLQGLGFSREDFDRSTSEFSGGWRMRIELAKLLLRRPDVLLLDEPTNHLDIESIQWLENFLSTRANAVVLVSHDRAFLNNVTTRTIEITCGQIYDYKVKYDEFVVLRKERREQQLRAYENQQKQIEDTEAFIERFRYKATKAVQVQSRIKQLEKIERIEVDEEDNSALRLKFACSSRSGSYPVICEDVRKAYGDHVIFHDVNLTINRGEKVAFVGKNGEGKSTLVKCIMGEITDYTGKLTLGHNIQIGYFAQNQAQLLDESLTVFDTIDRVAVGDIRLKIRDILGAEGLDIVQNTHHQQPQLAYKERDVHQQRSAKPNRGQHRIFRGNDFSAHGVLHHGAFFLGGMVLVEPGVQPFVDDIVGRGDHAGAEETDQRDTGQAAVGALPAYQQQREQRAGEDEQVFDPVVRTGDLDIVFHVEERPFLFKAVRGSGQGVPLEPFGRAVSQKRQHGRTGCREVHQIDVE